MGMGQCCRSPACMGWLQCSGECNAVTSSNKQLCLGASSLHVSGPPKRPQLCSPEHWALQIPAVLHLPFFRTTSSDSGLRLTETTFITRWFPP